MASRDRRGGLLQDVRTLFDTGTTGGLTDGELLGRLADRPARNDDDAAGPAFAALVDRHGPMVLRVCRSILRDEHDAQDAFQATFLVLVRRAGAVRRHESAGSWLHGVALRVAAHARAGMARRRRHERCAGELAVTADRSGTEGVSPELAAILHEELGRLPERYRAALVLCYLEGHTCEAAARRLGWPVGTVKSRLARGRERLRGRLIRRGVVPDETSECVKEVPISGLASASPPAPALVIPAALARHHGRGDAPVRRRPADRRRRLGGVALLDPSDPEDHADDSTHHDLGPADPGPRGDRRGDDGHPGTRAGSDPAGCTAKTAAQEREPAKPAVPEKKVEILSVRVIDTKGKGVPDVEIKVVEEILIPADDGSGYRTAGYRTDDDGRVRITVDRRLSAAHVRIATRRSNDRLGYPTIGPVVARRPRTTIPSH